MKHQMEEPAPLRSLRPDVPAALEDLVRRMMAKKPQDRPGTPAEVAAALEPLRAGSKAVPRLSRLISRRGTRKPGRACRAMANTRSSDRRSAAGAIARTTP